MSYKDTKVYVDADGIISNTVTAGQRDSVGIYPIDGGGGHASERLPQGIILKHGAKPILTDISKTIDTRIGSLCNFAEQYVLENYD